MAHPNKDELPAGGKTYALEKAIELLTEFDEQTKFTTSDMQWGIDHELEAIAAFTQHTGLEVHQIGDQQKFITLGNSIGGTPDGLIDGMTHSGIEIKCPKSKTHLEYASIRCGAELKAMAPEYYWQIQGLMLITDRESWWFVSYDPRFKDPCHRLHCVEIGRALDAAELLKERLLRAIVHRDTLMSEISRQTF